MHDTELRLKFWRDGSTQAERLAATVLKLSGFDDVDPQAPVGGPDGTKDIICTRGGVSWVGAVYFPTAPVRFGSVKKKFESDLKGVTDPHGGIVFITNQAISRTNRNALKAIGETASKQVEIIHEERLRAILDSPSGYGARLQFLKIPMTIDDQLSWFDESSGQVSAGLAHTTRELTRLAALIQRMGQDQSLIVQTMQKAGVVGLPTPDLISMTSFQAGTDYQTGGEATLISANISLSTVLLIHRLICFDLPQQMVGRLRNFNVTLGSPDGRTADHIDPPRAGDVRPLLDELCLEWNGGFLRLLKAGHAERLKALARFHARFLVIHPFLDGNGRAARAILMQQCLDLFGRADMSLMDKGGAYYRALKQADAGSIEVLAELIDRVVTG